jgi:hypothetical protein
VAAVLGLKAPRVDLGATQGRAKRFDFLSISLLANTDFRSPLTSSSSSSSPYPQRR